MTQPEVEIKCYCALQELSRAKMINALVNVTAVVLRQACRNKGVANNMTHSMSAAIRDELAKLYEIGKDKKAAV